jgi:hypothetical protein
MKIVRYGLELRIADNRLLSYLRVTEQFRRVNDFSQTRNRSFFE